MKACLLCATPNADEAATCVGCGLADFAPSEAPEPETPPAPAPEPETPPAPAPVPASVLETAASKRSRRNK